MSRQRDIPAVEQAEAQHARRLHKAGYLEVTRVVTPGDEHKRQLLLV